MTDWLVYAKPHVPPHRPMRWKLIAGPCTEEEARAKVAELRAIETDFHKKKLTHPLGAPPMLIEAHCVSI